MKRHINAIVILTLILFSCKDNSSFPKDLEKRIEGDWVIKLSPHSKIFIMFRLSKQMDSCSVFRFEKNKEFYWYWLDRKEKVSMLCGNALSPSEESTWQIDQESGCIILDKILSNSIDEREEEKISYKVYEFTTDTFTFQLDKTLIKGPY